LIHKLWISLVKRAQKLENKIEKRGKKSMVSDFDFEGLVGLRGEASKSELIVESLSLTR